MTAPSAIRRIVFVKRVLCDYQAPFFLRLQERLAGRASLTVLAGFPRPDEGLTDALEEVPVARRVATRPLAGKTYLTPGIGREVRGADLLLLEQASAQLINYPLLLKRALGFPPPVALVGHGGHLNRPGPAPLRDAWRRFWLRRADWFFAYTDLSARLAAESGFPRDRITVYQNAVDTTALRREAATLSGDRLRQLRKELFQEEEPHPTGVFCGRLVPERELPFLLQSLLLIHERLPAFRMVFIGDGPERDTVQAFCAAHAWCRWVGRQNGVARVPYLKLGHVFLYPAPVGLAILDAFAMGLPLATTDNGRHNPEIAYLSPGVNGLLTGVTPAAFAEAAAALLADPERLARMSRAALAEADLRTVERMAELFAEGIFQCLDRTAPV